MNRYFKKNPTPKEISFIAAGLTAFCVFLFSILVAYTGNTGSFVYAIGLTILAFVSAYFIFKNLLDRFIYRKIKVIFKSIHRIKSSKDILSEQLKEEGNILEKVEHDVKYWAKAHKKEVEGLKKMETYRREFMGNVSHELNTPLFSMLGYIEILLDGGIHNENINVDYLQKAEQNVHRMIHIVKDLDTISQLESGTIHLNIERFDIHLLVQEVIDALTLLANKKQIHLRFKDGISNSVWVMGDKEKIHQVLTNLVVNSIKYGQEKGTTWIGFYDMGQNILIEVTDTGIGIAEKDMKRVFERFYRVDKSRTRRDGAGKGLGLTIVKHIIEAHNQTINLRSSMTKGTTFGFTLARDRQ